MRAVQTAQIAADELDYKGDVVRTEALVPHGSPEKVWAELRDYREESAILLAGHEPLLSHLVAYLLAAPALRVEMKKAAMVRIDVESLGRHAPRHSALDDYAEALPVSGLPRMHSPLQSASELS